MEQKDKFEKKFSNFRHGVASKSPITKSKSNSIIRSPSATKTRKMKQVELNCKIEKQNPLLKHKSSKNSVETLPRQASIHDLQLQLSTLNSTLKHLPLKNIGEVTNYYQIVKEFIKQMISSPLYTVMGLLHSIYTTPLPTLLAKHEFNTKIYTEQPSIVTQPSQLFTKSKDTVKKYNDSSNDSSKLLSTTHSNRIDTESFKPIRQRSNSKKVNIKLNMQKIQEAKQNVKDYNDQFYDKLPEFSESWRKQALRQKR